MPKIFELSDLSSSESSDDERETDQEPQMISFRCYTASLPSDDMGDLFAIDTSLVEEEDEALQQGQLAGASTQKEEAMEVEEDKVDPAVAAALEKSVMHKGFEKALGEGCSIKSKNQLKRERRAEREKCTGTNWFDMPATELTEENKRDLEVLQMRSQLDPLAQYRKADREVLPKFFQIGKVIEHKADFYSSRLTKKQRKRTIVEELLADSEFQAKNRKRFDKVKTKEMHIRRQTSKKLKQAKRTRK
ncbi:hypothetical protein L596_020469 [Steinernema carpocapsae]|uniref:Fcf2 pre-rRNA processing C-terminal domain-containing protein n=1 Tax=Steinernema carpocapsae TaxID=34508 RepID=A0A4U5MTQ2_STECR|nr:hypothetical protein L596_020469 [Steinernema carpocapsae]